MKKIGLTTTVPIEVLIAAGYNPVDMNNLFVTSEDYLNYIDIAERLGFPKSMCAWIKGIYGACVENGIEEIVGVMEGDCSNTKVLIKILEERGIKVYPFSFPHSHEMNDVQREIDKFIDIFDVDKEEVESLRLELNKIRALGRKIDEMTLEGNKVDGFHNHLLQLCLSDFDGDYVKYRTFLEEKLSAFESTSIEEKTLKLGYIGVPPMTGDLYEFIESLDGRLIYNEVQREFAFPRCDNANDIYEQYYDFTYPYDFDFRVEEIKKQIRERNLDGIIHYTQAFCHKAAEDILLKQNLDLPILNIEGDKHNELDARTKLRIEAFMDMLLDQKEIR